MQRCSALLTHLVRGLGVGAFVHRVPDNVHVAIVSCPSERRVSTLRASQSVRRQVHATPRTANTHFVRGLDIDALVK